MASGASAERDIAPVLSALETLHASGDRGQKSQAHKFLETFQKSPEAWRTTYGILQSQNGTSEAKLFAATTLKGKIVYDLHQLPRETLPPLRDSLLSILAEFRAGPKPIRTQLCVCLADLAIHMTDWKNVLETVVSSLGTTPESIPCVLEFLHVLPEEVTEGRKVNLTEEELQTRTTELLQDNADQVLSLLTQYSQSSPTAAKDPILLQCITSWLREVPMGAVIDSPLLAIIMDGLSAEESFDASVECLSAIFKETREVDEYLNTIQALYPRILALKPQIAKAADAEDVEALKGITRVFAEAGEAWVVLIARMPIEFRGLVECVLECADRDVEREAIGQTFNFWYELKQYITLERYMDARLQYVDVYSKLVDLMIRHLQYPKPDSGNEQDLFEGDREQEEKFREFRHQMGDVLKDCCEVVGVTECLKKPYQLIEAWVQSNASQATDQRIPNWQALEAPLFGLRSMGRMVPPDENIMLPRLIPLIIQIPDNEKLRFQAVMAVGRYTEWTARHPATLQPQLNFIMNAFRHKSKEVVQAAALSFRYFCDDCASHLRDYMGQLQEFYDSILDGLPMSSQEEVTDGIASVISIQPYDKIYSAFKMTCDPVMKRLMNMAQEASDEKAKLALADRLQLVAIFVDKIRPFNEQSEQNPGVQYCQEIFPILAKILDVFSDFTPILERVCRCWRLMVLSYRSAITPLLPLLAEKLASGFSASHQGCFLWTTASIVREFSAGAENVDHATTNAIFDFCEQQTLSFLRVLNDLPPEELPDVIEDFFRLNVDVILFYPERALASSLMKPTISAASAALSLLKEEPLMATLHFLRDFLAYGTNNAPTSSLDDSESRQSTSPQIKAAVQQLLSEEGEGLTQRLVTGMMYTFPTNCLPDASGVLMAMFEIAPGPVSGWLKSTIELLPQGSITPQESRRFLQSIEQNIRAGEPRKLRAVLQDFTTSYRRRNVAPREGLGKLEAARFRFRQ